MTAIEMKVHRLGRSDPALMKAQHDMLDREDVIVSSLTDTQMQLFVEYQEARQHYGEQVRKILTYVSRVEEAETDG